MRKIIPIILSLVLFSCTNTGTPEGASENSKIIQREKIRQQEQQLIHSQTMTANPKKAAKLVTDYVNFANRYSSDSLAPEYLFKAAELDANVLGAGQTQQIYDRIIARYPDYKRLPEVYFLKGFVYEQKMHNKNMARQSYQKLIKEYPWHPLSKDAKTLIQNQSLSEEQLILKLQRGNGQ